MKKSLLTLTIGVITLTATSVIAQTPAAAKAPSPAPPPPSAYDKWENEVKNPAPWLSWGADLRLRNEYFDNAITLNDKAVRHEQDYFRFRERIWASVMPMTNLSVNARLAAEQREWMKPSYASQYAFRSGFEERYGILDNANVKWSNIGGQPLSITAGRQDIMFGDPLNWWLVADGTPQDGSWTFFFDSVRATFEVKEIKTKIDVVSSITCSREPDEWIPTIGVRSYENHPTPYLLTEQNEQWRDPLPVEQVAERHTDRRLFHLQSATTKCAPTATMRTFTPWVRRYPALRKRICCTRSKAPTSSGSKQDPMVRADYR